MFKWIHAKIANWSDGKSSGRLYKANGNDWDLVHEIDKHDTTAIMVDDKGKLHKCMVDPTAGRLKVTCPTKRRHLLRSWTVDDHCWSHWPAHERGYPLWDVETVKSAIATAEFPSGQVQRDGVMPGVWKWEPHK